MGFPHPLYGRGRGQGILRIHWEESKAKEIARDSYREYHDSMILIRVVDLNTTGEGEWRQPTIDEPYHVYQGTVVFRTRPSIQ